MNKKFLIPVLGVAIAAIALVSTNTNGQNTEALFVDSDNIAQAEGGIGCVPYINWGCTDSFGNTFHNSEELWY